MTLPTQTIFRVVNPNKAYTKLSNVLLGNRKISLGCKGFLVSILMLPTNWAFNVKWLQREFGLAKDRAYALVKEAIEHGYCKRVDERTKTGKMLKVEYYFSDDPIDLAKMGEPTGRPLPGNPEVDPHFPETPLPAKALTGNSGNIQIEDRNKGLLKGEAEPVSIVDGRIILSAAEHADWLGRFAGNAEDLRDALDQAAGYVEPRAPKPILVQVRSQLAAIARKHRAATSGRQRPQRRKVSSARAGGITAAALLEHARNLEKGRGPPAHRDWHPRGARECGS